MFKFFRRSRVPFEHQLSVLESCGVRLAPGASPEELFREFDRGDFEETPYRNLLIAMGGEAESESRAEEIGYLSDNIWHFDTECVEDHGDYATIARRMRTLAQGELPLEGISDYVDVEAGKAHVAFRVAGAVHHWDARVQDDWIDDSILYRFAKLLKTVGRGRRFTYYGLGQDGVIGCATADERARLAKQTGVKMKWL
jgi:hypothetical protein